MRHRIDAEHHEVLGLLLHQKGCIHESMVSEIVTHSFLDLPFEAFDLASLSRQRGVLSTCHSALLTNGRLDTIKISTT